MQHRIERFNTFIQPANISGAPAMCWALALSVDDDVQRQWLCSHEAASLMEEEVPTNGHGTSAR